MQTKDFATYREILNQPTVWQSTLDVIQQNKQEIAKYSDKALTVPMIFAGCGSPYYLSQTSATVFRQLTERSASAHPGSNIWLFPQSHLTQEKSLLLCVSRSGETTEVLKAIEQFRSYTQGDVITITCDEQSSIATLSNLVIPLPDAQEISLAQTQSFTAMLIASLMTITVLSDTTSDTSFKELPTACQALLNEYHDMAIQIGQNIEDIERIFFLGSDALYGIACEGMLKMKEMSLSYAEAFHFLEFRHGPKAMVNNKTLVIGLISEQAIDYERAVLREMRDMGAQTLALSPIDLDEDEFDYVVNIPKTVTGIARLPLYLPILQLIAYHRTITKGLDPDNPANLNAFVDLS